MKRIVIPISLIIKIILLTIIIIILFEIKNNQIIQIEELKKRTIIDSLYVEHLKTCSFISNDKIEIGYDNYIKIAD